MLDLGYKNYIDEKYVKSIIPPNSSHAKWLRKEAIVGRMLIDCTQGRKTNSLVIMDTGHVALSSLRHKLIIKRLQGVSPDVYNRVITGAPAPEITDESFDDDGIQDEYVENDDFPGDDTEEGFDSDEQDDFEA
jgi:regulator of extracellular matrix RemA (YlzA/DUF370 family)